MVEMLRIRNSTPTAVAALLERVTKAIEQVGKFKPEGVALAADWLPNVNLGATHARPLTPSRRRNARHDSRLSDNRGSITKPKPS
jgi:hypothetical protein